MVAKVRTLSPHQLSQRALSRLINWNNKNKGKIIVYHCAEFGVKSEIPTYSGGLGILAGDTLKSAADMGVPMIGVGMLPRDGYFEQKIIKGQQESSIFL